MTWEKRLENYFPIIHFHLSDMPLSRDSKTDLPVSRNLGENLDSVDSKYDFGGDAPSSAKHTGRSYEFIRLDKFGKADAFFR
jgi:hypothetical protein